MSQFEFYDGKERRQEKRIRARFVVTYRVDRPLSASFSIDKRRIQALMLDLSREGMALLTTYDIPRETILAMDFTLINASAPADKHKIKDINLLGEVRYSQAAPKNEHRLGIRFTRVSQEDREILSQFVSLFKS